jgi:hypothetical protein
MWWFERLYSTAVRWCTTTWGLSLMLLLLLQVLVF